MKFSQLNVLKKSVESLLTLKSKPFWILNTAFNVQWVCAIEWYYDRKDVGDKILDTSGLLRYPYPCGRLRVDKAKKGRVRVDITKAKKDETLLHEDKKNLVWRQLLWCGGMEVVQVLLVSYEEVKRQDTDGTRKMLAFSYIFPCSFRRHTYAIIQCGKTSV